MNLLEEIEKAELHRKRIEKMQANNKELMNHLINISASIHFSIEYRYNIIIEDGKLYEIEDCDGKTQEWIRHNLKRDLPAYLSKFNLKK